MPLASSRWRLAARSSSLRRCSCCTTCALLLFEQRRRTPWIQTDLSRPGYYGFGLYSAAAACASDSTSGRQQTDGLLAQEEREHRMIGQARDAAAGETEIRRRAAAQTSGMGHLKRRGPFYVQPLVPVDADAKETSTRLDLWGRKQQRGHGHGSGSGSVGDSQDSWSTLLGSQQYGKWRDLLFDYDRLLFESGLEKQQQQQQEQQQQNKYQHQQRSVDRPENATDMGLWSALFNFAQRRADSQGALTVWREIFERRQLHDTSGVVARTLWQAILQAALEAAAEEAEGAAFLESTWAYAEWMHDEHDTQWPHYYRTVVTFWLDSGAYDEALRWHVRLSAHFAVSRRDFFGVLRGFLAHPDPGLQDALRFIYATSHHRQLYDTIVPLLWSQGRSVLARAWRETLVQHDDLPASSGASRPFLQFLAGYYPEIELRPCEQRLAHEQQPARQVRQTRETRQTRLRTEQAEQEGAPARKAPDLPNSLFHLVNRVHGETYGIHEKPFNDKIGAKWFATSWVSLDTAIHLVYGLGIEEIGPLSVQSIALRAMAEGGPAAVVRRLQQLDEQQIGVGTSSYVRAIRYLAGEAAAETLTELLRSTLHPDVFDDIVMQRYVLGQASFTNDWKTTRLLLTVRLAVAEDAATAIANRLLLTCLHQQRTHTVLRLLDEFAARGIALLPFARTSLSQVLLSGAESSTSWSAAPADVDFCVALCRRLLALRLPVAVEVWQNILFRLGRQGRLTDLEQTALDIADRYMAIHATSLSVQSLPSPSTTPDDTAAFKVHVANVPNVVRGGLHVQGEPDRQTADDDEGDLGYRFLPRDLPLDHPLHPVSLIFRQNLQESMVRWYFHRKLAYRQGRGLRRRGGKVSVADFSLAGGIRLLALLRDRGVPVSTATLRSEALLCITALYGPPSVATRYWQPARAMNQLTLGEVKALCEDAWAQTRKGEGEGVGQNDKGEELLPSVDMMMKALQAMRPLAESFGNRISRPGDKQKMMRETILEAVSQPQSHEKAAQDEQADGDVQYLQS